MTSLIRCFIGVRIEPTPALQELMALAKDLGPGLKASPPGNLHVTLKFLGDVRASRIAEIVGAVAPVCRSMCPVDVTLAGVGVFPHRRRPSVLWVGIEPAELLIELAVSIDVQLARLGFASEARSFHPHLTLGRIKGNAPQGIFELLDLYAGENLGTAKFDRAALLQSELKPSGSAYTALEMFPFSDASGHR